jgi:hypothetical protein
MNPSISVVLVVLMQKARSSEAEKTTDFETLHHEHIDMWDLLCRFFSVFPYRLFSVL